MDQKIERPPTVTEMVIADLATEALDLDAHLTEACVTAHVWRQIALEALRLLHAARLTVARLDRRHADMTDQIRQLMDVPRQQPWELQDEETEA